MDCGAPTRTSGQALFQRVRFAQPFAALHTARTAEFPDVVQLWRNKRVKSLMSLRWKAHYIHPVLFIVITIYKPSIDEFAFRQDFDILTLIIE